ncbi:MAG: class I SAM-dependent methyltransferase [Pseudomonadota bacterium]
MSTAQRGGVAASAPTPAAPGPGEDSVSAALAGLLRGEIAAAGGWLPFERFMERALYAPGLGYYAREAPLFGAGPAAGSDFVTAPELSPLFGRALARQHAQALAALGGPGGADVIEFGAGSGALAEQLLDALEALGMPPRHYAIVELSAALRARQQARLARFGTRVRWLDAWPARIEGVVVGNEVLDAMPIMLLAFDGARWLERGVAWRGDGAGGGRFAWEDRPTALAPPAPGPFPPGYVTELHRQAQAFVRTLAGVLVRGAAFFVDYGFPEAEYYLPARRGGTLMCHRAHRADPDPLSDVGRKDITAHLDFSALALAAQEEGLQVVGYTSQARFLMNCGLLPLLAGADLRARAAAQKLLTEHEMGELFKVLGLARGLDFGHDGPLGFAAGDRTHTL